MPFNLVSDQKEQENASESRRIKEFEGLALVGALCGTGMGAVPIIHHSRIKRIQCNMIQGIRPAKLFAAFSICVHVMTKSLSWQCPLYKG